MHSKTTRRSAFAALGSAGFATALAACGADEPAATTAQATTQSTTEALDASGSCTLTPELTEGPYYFDVDSIRSDIREDRKGTLLTLSLRVRDADSCEPIANAMVDIWHCDAEGGYSGFESASQGGPGGGRTDEKKYLRGAQATDVDGVATFKTVYPGWYQGRTVHIHAKVHLDSQTALTTQLFFDDEVTDQVYKDEPYAADGERDQRNDSDGIFDESLILTTKREGDGWLGTLNFDVQRA